MPLIYGFRVSKAAEQGQISNGEVRPSSASETRLKNPMARDTKETIPHFMGFSLEGTRSEVYAISYSNTETEGDKQQHTPLWAPWDSGQCPTVHQPIRPAT